MKLKQSLAAMALVMAAIAGQAASGGGPATGSCTRQATEPSAGPIAPIPNYGGDAASADTADPRADASRKATLTYNRSIADALSRSSDPRDWAISTLFRGFEGVSTHGSEEGDALFARAIAAAPDETLILWMAVERSRADADPSRSRAMARLRELESGNAAVWLEDLIDGTKAKDERAIRTALDRMASSSTFDGHFVDLLRATVDVYRRFPPSDELVATFDDAERAASAEMHAHASAVAVSMAVALPGFQHLVNACRINAATGGNHDRASACAAVGRTLAASGDTLIANRIGLAVLRVSKTYDENDLRAARASDWIYDQYVALIPTDENAESPEDIARFQADWIETGSEVEAMRRAILRAGLDETPPEEWNDTKSIFTEERLRADQQVAARTAATE